MTYGIGLSASQIAILSLSMGKALSKMLGGIFIAGYGFAILRLSIPAQASVMIGFINSCSARGCCNKFHWQLFSMCLAACLG